jgi:hypothetical protein
MTWWRQLWLHDIGYAPELAGTGCHPLDGARYLRRIGVDEQVVSLVAYHSCARIEAEVRGLRPATAHRVHRTARTAFGEAVKRGYIARNPVAVAKPPRVDELEVDPFEAEEIERILTVALRKRNGVRFVIALALGLRQGEALGLKWSRPHAGCGLDPLWRLPQQIRACRGRRRQTRPTLSPPPPNGLDAVSRRGRRPRHGAPRVPDSANARPVNGSASGDTPSRAATPSRPRPVRGDRLRPRTGPACRPGQMTLRSGPLPIRSQQAAARRSGPSWSAAADDQDGRVDARRQGENGIRRHRAAAAFSAARGAFVPPWWLALGVSAETQRSAAGSKAVGTSSGRRSRPSQSQSVFPW